MKTKLPKNQLNKKVKVDNEQVCNTVDSKENEVSEKTISTTLLDMVAEFVSNEFNLADKNYKVTFFKQNKDKIGISLHNGDFTISVVVHKPDRFNLIDEEEDNDEVKDKE